LLCLLWAGILFSQSTQDFEGTFPPSGWINNGCFKETTANNCGGSSSCGFNILGDAITTPYLFNAINITFDYLRSSNPTDWTLVVEEASSTSGPWTPIGSVSDAIQTCQTVTFGVSTNRFVRFRDARPSGGSNERYIDDVTVQDGSLPIVLSSFKAAAKGKSNILYFSTATERDNAYFDIERSADGHHFTGIGRLAGAGTSNRPQEYTFEDKNPLKGINYYRLRQVDFTEQSVYSLIVSATNGQTGQVTLSPSPAAHLLEVRLQTGAAEGDRYEIMDQSGKTLQSGVLAAETHSFTADVSALREGLYFLRIVGAGQALVRPFLKSAH
jgi:hypothetical protein